MKKYLVAIALMLSQAVFAQEEFQPGFKRENLMAGGSVTASFGSNGTVLGATPYIGYSLLGWLDAGVQLNYVYSGTRHITYYSPSTGQYYYSDDKLRQHTYGPGMFVRAYVAKQLFMQMQGEYNWISQKVKYDNGAPSTKEKTSAPSFLIGGGYASGRMGPKMPLYYISIMFDVAKDRNSPYVEITRNNNINVLPVIRAGVQFPLGLRRE